MSCSPVWSAVLALAVLSVAAGPARAQPSLDPAELDRLVAFYEHLHRNPELSFYEKETAAKVVSELEPLGFEVTRNVGGHGFVAVLENGSGPTVLVRTDLDGLPVVEETGRPYASDRRTTDDAGDDVGVMHACAHDIHMTSFVGVARRLAGDKSAWRGTLVMIGQPAEERGAGAKAMLDDGLFERFPKPDYALALHTSADLRTGTIGYTFGPAMAAVDSVDITVRGVGGHGAYPHLTKDPVVISAHIITALQTIVSRETSPIDAAVVTVGQIHGGTKRNIIPPEVKMDLTVRSYTDETRERTLGSIRRIALNTAQALGVPPEREPILAVSGSEATPALLNSAELGKRLVPAWGAAIGEGNVLEIDPVMGGEDFARYGRTGDDIPVFLFWLGSIDRERFESGEPLPSLHSPFFWPDPRPTIETGVKAMTAGVLELMGR